MSEYLRSFLFAESPVFLQKKINFLAFVAVLLTTLFGWNNPNSWCILLLVACRLLDGSPSANVKAAFSNRLFVVYFVFFLVDAAGYLHTHDLVTQGKVVSKEATLVAIAFVICAGPFADQRRYRQLITAYSLLLLVVSFYCLVMACREYQATKQVSAFFYHALTDPIHQNAVFFSVYMFCAIVFLLSSYGEPAIGLSPRGRKILRYALLIFFLGMMVLLSSRLLLVITVLFMMYVFLRRYSFRKNRLAVIVGGSLVFAAAVFLAVTDNPVRQRFYEMANGSMAFVRQEKFSPDNYFNPWEARLIEWRFALEILNARRAWLFGVSPGDSQNLLDQKYIAAHMYIGNPADGPNRHIRGFLGFNFHNQFIETLVRTGLVGLASLLAIFIVLLARARKYGVREAWFIVLTIAVFFIPQAPLTLQQGVFLFCFFPLLALRRPEVARTGQPG